MFKMTGILVATLLAGTLAHARFLPEDLMVSSKMSQGPSNINEEQFNTLIQKIQTVYAPIVKTFGASLSISGSWNSQTLNAGATQVFGYWWKVAITGAIARRPELTPDGFSLIVCHEVGHHLGGFSFAKPPTAISAIA